MCTYISDNLDFFLFFNQHPSTPRDKDKGWTFDSVNNHNIRQTERMRYDRVLARSGEGLEGKSNLVPVDICLVGQEEIDVEHENNKIYKMHPSDHFGLLCTFDIIQ